MKNFKSLIISLCVSVTLCFSVGFFSLGETSRVYADGNGNYFTAEEYTDNDELLRSDGTSSAKDIQMFSAEVKAGKSTYYPELAEVIPRQYLESQEKNATFAYNGKEYGFYVVKNEEKFDVLLVDFVYEFDENDSIHNSDIEFRIRIKPLLQQSFLVRRIKRVLILGQKRQQQIDIMWQIRGLFLLSKMKMLLIMETTDILN